MTYNTTPLVTNGAVRANWLPDDRFWYRNQTATGSEFILVDAARGTKAPAFNHAAVAAALTHRAGGETIQRGASAVPADHVRRRRPALSRSTAMASAGRCDVQGKQCAASTGRATPPNSVMSPDGKQAAFIRDYNLWVRDLAAGTEKQLTTDGVKDFGYATDNAGWIRSDRPVVVWSPDSKKIATFQQDERGVGEMYLVNTDGGTSDAPGVEVSAAGRRGDHHHPARDRRRRAARRSIRLQMPADQHRSTICDDVKCGGEWVDVQWNPDGSEVAFVSTSRDHKEASLRVADAATGAVPRRPQRKGRDVLRVRQRQGQLALSARNRTRRSGFRRKTTGATSICTISQTGQLKNPITSGDGNVTQLQRVDEDTRDRSTSTASAARGAAIPTSAISIASAWTARARSC